MEPHGDEPLIDDGERLGFAPVLVLVHGRGSTPESMLELIPRLGCKGWTYLAPAAAGGVWYPYNFMTVRSQNEPGISSGLDVFSALMTRIMRAGVPPGKIVWLGFSQGACLVAAFLARHPRRYGAGIMFSGGLIGPPGTIAEFPGSLKGTPVFLGGGAEDPHVPRSRVEESAALFTKMGAQATCRIYPGGDHHIRDDEIAIAQGLMKGVESGR